MLPCSEACERNKAPILEVLRIALAERSQVLEIGSGTGQHAVHFAAHLPHLDWQPTERLAYLPELIARCKLEGSPNLSAPTVLDVNQPIWPLHAADAVFTANTLHIMSWAEVMQMFARLDTVLLPGGVLCVYGPFRYDERYTSGSNREFDRLLKERDPRSGLREIAMVTALAARYGIRLRIDHDLPANNRLLEFVKE